MTCSLTVPYMLVVSRIGMVQCQPGLSCLWNLPIRSIRHVLPVVTILRLAAAVSAAAPQHALPMVSGSMAAWTAAGAARRRSSA